MLKTTLQMVLDPMKMLLTYLLGRFTEPSTWAAIVGYVAFHEFHAVLPDNLNTGIINVGVAAATLLAIILQEGRTSANAVRKDLLKTMALAHMVPSLEATPVAVQTPQAVITEALMAYVNKVAPSWEQGYIDGFVGGAAPMVVSALRSAGYTIISTPVQGK